MVSRLSAQGSTLRSRELPGVAGLGPACLGCTQSSYVVFDSYASSNPLPTTQNTSKEQPRRSPSVA